MIVNRQRIVKAIAAIVENACSWQSQNSTDGDDVGDGEDDEDGDDDDGGDGDGGHDDDDDDV